MGQNQHVVPHADQWAVRGAGNHTVTHVFETQQAAIAFARQEAMTQRSELFIHGQDGQIRERNSYGNDPHPPKG